jgi:hypothetical protein
MNGGGRTSLDTPPAGGDGDTLHAPWPYNLPYNQQPKTGPHVPTSPDGDGARRNPKTEDGHSADANPGGGGNKPLRVPLVAAPGGEWPNNGNLRTIGSNSRANQISEQPGYESAEDLKDAFGGVPHAKFDLYTNGNDVYMMGKGGLGVPEYVGTLPQ